MKDAAATATSAVANPERITLKNREVHYSNFSIEDIEDETRIGGKTADTISENLNIKPGGGRSHSSTQNGLSFLTPFSPLSQSSNMRPPNPF